ncbi:MAG TPA: NADH-quinone oxidoreductase subunit C [Candidatus Edwardsbacteria bacterium]|nr:NADH-quinone oxidoreductase subunit C [Candidatus Edwardsbacteria bacterium]
MTAEDVKKTLEQSLAGKIVELTNPQPRRMFLHVAPEHLVEACKVLRDQLGFYHLTTITGRDTGDKLEALYHFAQAGMVLTVRAQTGRAHPSLPTIIAVYPGATFYEREVHDMVGIVIDGHPDMRPLVLPEGWPDGIYPMRKDWQYNREKGVIQ